MATLELREAINELEKRLRKKRESGNIGPKQTAILNSIENGSLTGPQLGLILQGASFGFSDELIGYLPRPGLNPIVQTLQNQGDFQFQGNMPFPGSDSPDFPDQVATEIERRTLDQYREENPVSALGLEAAGGLPFLVQREQALQKPQPWAQGVDWSAVWAPQKVNLANVCQKQQSVRQSARQPRQCWMCWAQLRKRRTAPRL